MAHLLGADGISLTAGTRNVFDAVSLGLDDGDRVGVVGPNGAGKSTLLRLLAGRQVPDAGRVTRVSGLRLGLLDQRDDEAAGATIRALVHGDAAEHAWASDPGVRAVHIGLLADLDLDAPAETLSGGQRRRVALAALLVADYDVLLLDEPTNHLDVEGVDWLAGHLRERFARAGARGALVVVTHDRWFLDAVCTRMWEVTGAAVEGYDGGYAAYILARAERARTAAVAAEKRNNLLRKELAWLRRGAPARTSKPRFRLDAAAARVADEPPPRDSLELTRMATRRLGKDVLDLEGVTVTVPLRGRTARTSGGGPAAVDDGAVRVLFDDVTWRLGPGDRFGVVGVNGAGKTTLLALLAGRREPDTGRVKRGKTVHVAELSQDVGELDDVGGLRVVDVIEREKRTVAVGGKELTASQLVERLGFTRERAHTLVRDLSGGERRRLQLLRLLVAEPNVLLLDEPTNDLDTDTLAAVEDLLDGWPGTLVVVSHDRYLLERVTDREVALLGDGTIRDLPGGVDEYLRLRASSDVSAPARGRTSDRTSSPAIPGAELRAAEKELASLERRIEKRQQQAAGARTRLADLDQSDYQLLTAETAKITALDAEVAALEDRWLELSAHLESLTTRGGAAD